MKKAVLMTTLLKTLTQNMDNEYKFIEILKKNFDLKNMPSYRSTPRGAKVKKHVTYSKINAHQCPLIDSNFRNSC